LKTVHVAMPITFFKDDKTGKYSYEYGEMYPKSLEIEGATVKFVNDLELETARE